MKMRNFLTVHRQWMHFFCSFIFIFLSAYFSALGASDNYTLDLEQQNRSNEVMALLVFKQKSVDADPEGFLNDWRSESLSPCSWQGVFCSPHGKVSMVNFTDAGLIGHLHMDYLIVLESLQHLHLNGNSFSGNLFLNKTSYPSCIIETLDLSFNNLSEPISETFLDSCDHLASLNLSHNSIPGGSFNFGTSLVELDLSSNLISYSSILDYSLSSCQNVKLLNLSHNKISGKLDNLSSCENLSILDLSDNILAGDIPAVLFSDFSRSFKSLDLSNNNLSGNFPMFEFKNSGKLVALNLSDNVLYGIGIPQSLTNCQLLENLDVSNNKLQGNIPAALGNLGNLKHLNLAHNNLSGNIPPDLGWTCGTLVELDLSGNKLSGGFPETFKSCKALQKLNLGNNQLSGNFLTAVISTLPSLKILQIPFNNISGSIPLSLTNCAQLQVLDLSSNAFTRDIPSGLCSNSTFSSSLKRLLLADNFLSGTIPLDIGNCKNLKTINFARNNLSGSIPSEVWKLPNIYDFVMWGNNFSGDIPKEICFGTRNLEKLILNNNLFSGEIPKLSILQLSYNSFFGNIQTAELGGFQNLLWLDLSSNHFTDLAHNSLTGTIPNTLGGLTEVCLLNLSYNSLDGMLPGSLGQISFLTELDVSNNNLTGPIPSSGQLTTFPASSYENNRGLCGIPLSPCGYHPETDPIRSDQSQNGKNLSTLRNVDWIWVIAVIGYIFGVAIGVCVGNIMFQDKEEWLIKTKLMIISKRKRTKKKSCRIIDKNIHDRRENWNEWLQLFVLLEGCVEFDRGMSSTFGT
ncbi:hypothetical protein CRYUN_Cryun38cG0035900 [Craigia yunnanensis]